MTVITISRQLGSHGEEIAATVSDALGLRLIDAETINEAALKAGVPQIALDELEREGERGLVNQVLAALRTMPSLRGPSSPAGTPTREGDTTLRVQPSLTIPFTGLFSPTVPPISASLEGHVRMVGLVVQGLAREGNVLIVGRGGQVLLKKHPRALHVQIVAPFAHRVAVVAERLGTNQRNAQHRVRASDRARFDYVRRYHDADWMAPAMYHLVLNTGWMSTTVATDLIVAAQQAIVGSPDAPNKDE
jgi:cytidylate kinase